MVKFLQMFIKCTNVALAHNGLRIYAVQPKLKLKYKTLKYMKNLIEKLKALRSFFCRHKWVDFKIRNFDEPKMDSKGRLATKMLIRECSKCGKMECFAMN